MSESAEQQEISSEKRVIDRRSRSIGPLGAEIKKGNDGCRELAC